MKVSGNACFAQTVRLEIERCFACQAAVVGCPQPVADCPQAGSPGKWVRLLEVSGSACFAHQHPVVVGEGSGTYLVVGPVRHWKEY